MKVTPKMKSTPKMKMTSKLKTTSKKINSKMKTVSKMRRTLNTSLAAPGALAHRLQHHTAFRIPNSHQRDPKWLTLFGEGSTPKNLGTTVNFSMNVFFCYSSPPYMRNTKIRDGHQRAPKWPMWSKKGSTQRFWGAPVNFHKISLMTKKKNKLRWECHTRGYKLS